MESHISIVCPLPRSAQTRNLLLFAACTGLIYLGAPVGYVGVTQASLCRELGSRPTVANLPATVYFACTAAPIFVAWFMPYVRWLKRMLALCFGFNAAALAAVSLILPFADIANNIKILAVIAQAGVAGVTMPGAIMFLWEVVGRGVSERRRGQALALAFGLGPILAAIASYGSQLLLDAKLFALLYGLASPVIGLAALLACFFIVPLPERDKVREPFVHGVFGGIWNFLNDRVLMMALVVTFLVYAGNAIPSNLNLYAENVVGKLPTEYAGMQNMLRFACKAVAGLFLGWLLTRTSPRAGLVTTAAIYLAAVIWPLLVTGPWYHAAFVIYGAGELVGVYAPNYILSASRKVDMRRNLAIVTLLMAPGALYSLLFGAIADFGKMWGEGVGFQISFIVCAAFILAGIVLAALFLPVRPKEDHAV